MMIDGKNDDRTCVVMCVGGGREALGGAFTGCHRERKIRIVEMKWELSVSYSVHIQETAKGKERDWH